MFTALILMCALGVSDKDPGACFTIMSQQYFESEKECKKNTFEFISTPDFHNTYKNFRVNTVRCLNWNDIPV